MRLVLINIKKYFMIKKILFVSIILLTTALSVKGQNSWGVKGSLIFNSNGELIKNASEIIDNKGKGEAGFNVGVYGVLNLGPIYIRPELVYSQASSEYTIDNSSESFKMSSIDLPVLVGIKIIGPLNLVVGPAFKFILNNEFAGYDSTEIQSDVTVGLNIGASVEFGRFGVDVIYDRGFSENEAAFLGTEEKGFTIDARQQQIKVGLSYRLSSDKRR